MVLIIVIGLMPITALANDTRVSVNDQIVQFDRPVRIAEDVILAPIRPVADLVGAEVRWNANNRTATVILGNTGVAIAMDNPIMVIRNMTTGAEERVTLAVTARIVDVASFVPLEPVSRALGLNVQWDDANRTLQITTPGFVPSEEAAPATTQEVGQVSGMLQRDRFPTQLQSRSLDIANHTTATQFTDSFTAAGQRNDFSWTAPSSTGTVFFGITGLSTGNVDVFVFNSAGSEVARNTLVGNNGGVMVSNLISGETYTVQVRQRTGLSQFTLSIVWKETMNLSSITEAADSIRFNGQRNNYTWTAPSIQGSVFFGITGLSTGNVDVFVFNSAGSEVGRNTLVGNNSGVMINNVVSGETYTVQVRQRTGLNPYKLNITWK
jgi:hypothetical protein